MTLRDVLVSGEASPEEVVTSTQLRDNLNNVLWMLSPMERPVVCLRYGWFDSPPMALEELAKAYQVPLSRVRQTEIRALRQLSRTLHRIQKGRSHGVQPIPLLCSASALAARTRTDGPAGDRQRQRPACLNGGGGGGGPNTAPAWKHPPASRARRCGCGRGQRRHPPLPWPPSRPAPCAALSVAPFKTATSVQTCGPC